MAASGVCRQHHDGEPDPPPRDPGAGSRGEPRARARSATRQQHHPDEGEEAGGVAANGQRQAGGGQEAGPEHAHHQRHGEAGVRVPGRDRWRPADADDLAARGQHPQGQRYEADDEREQQQRAREQPVARARLAADGPAQRRVEPVRALPMRPRGVQDRDVLDGGHADGPPRRTGGRVTGRRLEPGRRIGQPHAGQRRLAEAAHLGRADQQQEVSGPGRVGRQAVHRAERDGHGGADLRVGQRVPGDRGGAHRMSNEADAVRVDGRQRPQVAHGGVEVVLQHVRRSSGPEREPGGVGAVSGEIGQHDHISPRHQRVAEAAHQPGRRRSAVGHDDAGRPARDPRRAHLDHRYAVHGHGARA